MIPRYFSHHSLNIFSFEKEVWEYPEHTHNFYELIFIESGHGLQIMNDVTFSYTKGDVFLLGPNDKHRFEIKEKTVFTFLKFTEQLFAEKNETNATNNWQRKIDRILLNPNTQPGAIIYNENDYKKVFQILEIIKEEYLSKDIFSRRIVLELFGALITIIARNLQFKNNLISPEQLAKADKITALLSYVRQHIFDSSKLSIQNIAETFLMSPNYVGTFIKKHTGMNLQQLITQTKLKTAERLLGSSKLTVSEIAIRLQFTDASHFTKFFKKHKGITPKVYRNKKNLSIV
ncbi:AraC family transcriptional regulator [Tenacibaculum sp. TC6]|uniref:AraC family transcriptional regulator n=1 Tax=Tenacibaculum sp. TC6 TaxID=3423223 RepID=UPI003D36F2B7